MGAQTFGPVVIANSGLSASEQKDEPLVKLVGQIMDLTSDEVGYTGVLLAQLTCLVERHAWRVEQVLQRADSSALGAARRSHEALLLHLEQLQEVVLDPKALMVQLHLVCSHLLDLMIVDARAVRQCTYRSTEGVVFH
jgi:hypothetical protein